MNAKLTIWLPKLADAGTALQAVRPLIPSEFTFKRGTFGDNFVAYELWCRGSLRTMGLFVEAVHAALPDMDVTLSAGNARGEILCIEYEAGNPKPVQSHVREYEGWCDYAW